MLYSCTHMATLGIKGLTDYNTWHFGTNFIARADSNVLCTSSCLRVAKRHDHAKALQPLICLNLFFLTKNLNLWRSKLKRLLYTML